MSRNCLLTDEVFPLVPVLVIFAIDAGDADGGSLPLQVSNHESGHPHGRHVVVVRLRMADESVPDREETKA